MAKFLAILDDIRNQLRAPAAPDGSPAPSPYTQHFILTMWLGAGLGVLALPLIALSAFGVPAGLRMVGASLLGMVASMAVGGLLGMLFGIPRIDYRDRADPAQGPQIRQNDSLEQIADWLTKTIVGVTLVQSEQVGQKLQELGTAFSVQIYGLPDKSYMAGLATILAFAVMGFLLAYTWTRRYWVLEMEFILQRTIAPAANRLDDAMGRIAGATQRPAEQAVSAATLTARAATATGWSRKPVAAAGGDPWSGQFGGQALNGEHKRRLRIEFKHDTLLQTDAATPATPWIQLRLVVEATDTSRPLTGTVRFFLHPTFPEPIRDVQVKEGIAAVELRAWGGDFTVGVLTDGGQCALEQHVASCAPAWVPAAWRQA